MLHPVVIRDRSRLCTAAACALCLVAIASLSGDDLLTVVGVIGLAWFSSMNWWIAW